MISTSRRDKIFFDLEMTGGTREVREIVSIGAVYGSSAFKIYIRPNSDINWYASQKHGITKRGNMLFLNGEPLLEDVYSPERGLEMFGEFVADIMDEIGDSVYLVGHAAFANDMKVLLKCFQQYDVDVFFPLKVRVLDTQDLVRKLNTLMEECRKPRLCSGIGLNDLLREFVGRGQSEVHDALEDAKDCRALYSALRKRFHIKEHLISRPLF